jgi:hypothetical protein
MIECLIMLLWDDDTVYFGWHVPAKCGSLLPLSWRYKNELSMERVQRIGTRVLGLGLSIRRNWWLWNYWSSFNFQHSLCCLLIFLVSL